MKYITYQFINFNITINSLFKYYKKLVMYYKYQTTLNN